MIINEQTIKISINGSMIKRYVELGYNVKNKDIIEIPLEHLNHGSNYLIKVICDSCNKINEISYKTYNNYHKLQYYCYDCRGNGIKNAVNKKYGVNNVFQLNTCKNKAKETCLEKYGEEFYLQSALGKNAIAKTNLERYGCINVFAAEKIKAKIKETCLKRYGVDSVSKNYEIYTKIQLNGFKAERIGNLICRGSYEKDFVKYCIERNIINDIENAPTIYFDYKNKTNKVYFPDFYIKKHNLIIEIKSSYYYNLYLDLNLAKQKATVDKGYNYLFIIDKNYTELNNILNNE